MINLKLTGVYRDGGTCDYIDDDGNKYHQYQNMIKSTVNNKEGGKLYLGSLRDKLEPVLAEGKFSLEKRFRGNVNDRRDIIIEQYV